MCHLFAKTAYSWAPYIAGILTVVFVPILFFIMKSLKLASLINGFSVIIGVITMAHFSLEIASLWANIVTLLSKFVIRRAIFCLEVYPLEGNPNPKGWGLIRYPKPGLLVCPFRHLDRGLFPGPLHLEVGR